MKEGLFDEVDLNYILAAVVHHKVRIMKMEDTDRRWLSAEFRKEYIQRLTTIEGKIIRELDGVER
jgi:hypothetical protein